MDNARLAAAKTAYETAYEASLTQFRADNDHAAFSARNVAASKQYKAVEQEVYAAVEADLTAQARQDCRHDEFF
jgi:hypothetical protein